MEARPHVQAAVALLFLSMPAVAAPVFLGSSFTIDKADCCTDYSVGVNVDVTGSSPVSSVVVTHVPVASGSVGTWALAQLGATWWWNWSPTRPPFSTGPLDGVFSIQATDTLGFSTTAAGLAIPADAELAFPNVQITLMQSAYLVASDPVLGAEYYNLWVVDHSDGHYAHYQTVDDPADLVPMPFSDLALGHTYTVYFMAVNVMPNGSLSSHFRSYNMRRLVHMPTAALLEQLRLAVIGVGPGTSLADKVTVAQTYFAVPDTQSTCAVLAAFQNEVRAQTDKKVSSATASQLIQDSSEIMAQIGCQDDRGAPIRARVGTKETGSQCGRLPPQFLVPPRR